MNLSLQGGAAAYHARQLYGGPIRPVERTVSVTTAATRLVQGNPDRVGLIAVNRSINFGAIGFAPDVSAGTGIYIGAAGGTIESRVQEDGDSVTWELWAINDTAAGNWRVIEFIRT